VRPGKTYDVSAWLRTANVTGSATLAATFSTGTSYLPSATSAGLAGTQPWTQRTLQVTAPAGATHLRVELRLYGPGTLWADDTAVTEQGAQPGPVNLAPDPDFEVSPGSAYYTAGAASFTWASDQSHSPSHALKVVSTQPAGTLTRWMSRVAEIAVTPGRTYAVSAWLRTSGAGTNAGRLAATFYTGSYLPSATSAQTLSGTTGWTLVTLTVTAPAGATNLRVEFRLYGPGTLWADDVSVTEE
jgi:hypothetical protein